MSPGGLCLQVTVPLRGSVISVSGAGNAMPRDCMNFNGRRTCHNTCKAIDQVNGQIPGTCVDNEDANCLPASATTSCASTSVVPGKVTKSHWNNYINNWYNGRSKKCIRKQGCKILPATEALAADRVKSGGISGGISVNRTSMATHNSDQVAPQLSLSAVVKNHRRRKKFRHKKSFYRDTEDVYADNCHPVLIPKQEEEDWENEIQEVTLTDWERMCFGVKPYGPEDVPHFAMQDLSLKQGDMVDLQVTASYSPAVHHPQPVPWFCYSTPTEPDQFADADV
ncbi:hypothetical protein EXN66_Car003208 [Channa argus]|uniref:Uncharacterized protein n=1 Tax=Channa argus TaxID=215402 RepID=A0A6G1PBX9_CHAAH|nr:hypothetical protein EXN66_Car003208 [Channa argus]KAK2919090.1 hypothetical protein Q8A73_003461 [Channa argus]